MDASNCQWIKNVLFQIIFYLSSKTARKLNNKLGWGPRHFFFELKIKLRVKMFFLFSGRFWWLKGYTSL